LPPGQQQQLKFAGSPFRTNYNARSRPDISFANCGLPYYIGGDIKSRSKLILQSPESFNEQYGVDVRTNTTVTAIDRTAHQVKPSTADRQAGNI
jgi:hypothetical protein